MLNEFFPRFVVEGIPLYLMHRPGDLCEPRVPDLSGTPTQTREGCFLLLLSPASGFFLNPWLHIVDLSCLFPTFTLLFDYLSV